ncbi:hypothetical protein FNF28_05688 [Cafeteria roenbergensis]|uniref:EF-hand domain-containing protein n=1 Tax=Cafeteria roenbergensis TaxID=33653 RepID=A0A5A8D3L8_CAFRO|nr:hypothetical protein FNF28_05688 [Cafeteria roenbergensis]
MASKRGYAFQVRRVFRVFCLILTLALVAGLWIGITTVLGRATISERYDPSNELAVRVKGCDVRVERGTANTVSLNRWRGSGMSQRLHYATSGTVIHQLDALNVGGCDGVFGMECARICLVTVSVDPDDPPVRIDVRQLADDDNTNHVRFTVLPGVKADTIWLAGSRLEVSAEGTETSSLVVRGGRGDVYAVDNTFSYADLRSPNGAVYLLETKPPAEASDRRNMSVRFRSNAKDVCFASQGSADFIPDTVSQGSVWSGSNDGSWGSLCEPLNPNFYFPRTRDTFDRDKDGFVTTEEFDEGVEALDRCCGSGCPYRSFCGSVSNQLFAPRPAAAGTSGSACCSRTGVVETFDFVNRLRELNDTSFIPLCQRNIEVRDAAVPAPAGAGASSVTASLWADDGHVRVHRVTEADPASSTDSNSSFTGATTSDPAAGLAFWAPNGGIPGLKMHRSDAEELIADIRDVYGPTSATGDVFVTIDVVGAPGVPGGRWVWTTRPIFLYLQPSLLQFLSGGLLNPPLRTYRVHMATSQCDAAATTGADGAFRPGKPLSDVDHADLAARRAAVFQQLRTALTPRFQLEMRGVLVEVGENHQPLPDAPHLTAYAQRTDGSIVSAPFQTSNDESTTAAVLLSVGMALLVALALTGFLMVYMRSALKSRYSRERVRAKLLAVRAEAARSRQDKDTADKLEAEPHAAAGAAGAAAGSPTGSAAVASGGGGAAAASGKASAGADGASGASAHTQTQPLLAGQSSPPPAPGAVPGAARSADGKVAPPQAPAAARAPAGPAGGTGKAQPSVGKAVPAPAAPLQVKVDERAAVPDGAAIEAAAGDGAGTDGVDTGDLDSAVERRGFNPLETPIEVVNMLLVAPVRRQLVDSVNAFVNERCAVHVKPPSDDDDDDDDDDDGGCCGCCGGGGASRSDAKRRSAAVRPAGPASAAGQVSPRPRAPGTTNLASLPSVTFDEFHDRYCAFTYSQDLSEVQSRAQIQGQLIMQFNMRVRGQVRETLQGVRWRTPDGAAPTSVDAGGVTAGQMLGTEPLPGAAAGGEGSAAAEKGEADGGSADAGTGSAASAAAAAATAAVAATAGADTTPEQQAAVAAAAATAAAAAADASKDKAPAKPATAAEPSKEEDPQPVAAPAAPAYDATDARLVDAFLARYCEVTKRYSSDSVLLTDVTNKPRRAADGSTVPGSTERGFMSLLNEFCASVGVEEPTHEEAMTLLRERGMVTRKRRHKRIYGVSFLDGSAAAARPRLGCMFFAVESFSVLVHLAVFCALPALCLVYALQMQYTHGVTVATASQRALSRYDLAEFPPVLTGKLVFVVRLIVIACLAFLGLGLLRILVRYLALPKGMLRTVVRKAFALVLVVVVFSMFFVIGLVLAWFVLAAALDPTRFLPYGAGAICALVVALTTFKQLSRAAQVLRVRIQQAFKQYMAKAASAAKSAMEQTAKFERQREAHVMRRKAAGAGAAAGAPAPPTEAEAADFKVEDIFALVNSDGDAELTRAEFDDLFERLNVNLSASKRDQLFSMSDADGSGMIDQQEFVDAWDRIEEEIIQDTLESLGVSDAAIAGFVLYLLLLLAVAFAFIFTAIRAWENSSSFEAVVQSLLVTGSGVLTQVTRARPKGEDGDEQSISEIVDSVVKGDEAS